MPVELTLHCLRHSYVTHLIEAGYDPLFVQQQVGHSYASTTALYTSVSANYRSQILRNDAGQDDRRRPMPALIIGALMVRKINFRWNLRQLMAAHDLWKTTELIPAARRTRRQSVRDPGVPPGGQTSQTGCR